MAFLDIALSQEFPVILDSAEFLDLLELQESPEPAVTAGIPDILEQMALLEFRKALTRRAEGRPDSDWHRDR